MAILLAAGFALPALAAVQPIKPPASIPLTQAQIAQMKADRAAMDSQRAQMKTLSDQLRSTLKSKPVDQNRVSSLTKQLNDLRDSMTLQRMQMMSQRQNLTPAQQKRYSDMVQRIKDRQAKRQLAK